MRTISDVWTQISRSKKYTLETVNHLKQLIEWEFDQPFEDYITLISEQIARVELPGTEHNPDGTSGGKYIFCLMELQCLGNSLYYILQIKKYHCKHQNKECSNFHSLYVEPQDYKHLQHVMTLLGKLDDLNSKAFNKSLKHLPQETQDKIWDMYFDETEYQLKRNLML